MNHKIAENNIKKNYGKRTDNEWRRLVKDAYHRLEFETTLRFLKKYLPKKGLILDAGGGPGRYTIELAKLGYKLVLLDVTPENLAVAQKKIKKAKLWNNINGIIEGTITNLSIFKDESFDAVICLGGPLSHVGEEKYRLKALTELKRVARKKAPIFVSVMGKMGCLSIAPSKWPKEIKTNNFERLIAKGDDHLFHGKYFCHFFTNAEMEKLFKKVKIELIQEVGLEGISTPNQEAVNKLYKDKIAWKKWEKLHKLICTHPTVVNMSIHMLFVGIKKNN